MGGYAYLYGTGASGELYGRLGLGSLFGLRGAFSYSGVPVKSDESFSLLSVGAGPTLGFDPLPWLRIEARGMGGYYYAALMTDDSVRGYNPCWEGGLSLSARLGPSFSLGLDAAYRSFLYFVDDLRLSATVMISFQSKASKPAADPGLFLAVDSLAFSDVYPLFYKHYDEHPFGSVELSNRGATPAEGIRVSVFIKEYMPNPKVVPLDAPLGPGESVVVDLYALFSRSILSVSETTKASVELVVSYTAAGKENIETRYETVRIFDRNAMTWDDDRKAAAFVSAKDPTVSKFARNALSCVAGVRETALDKNLLAAVAVHRALCLHGIAYSSAPVAALKAKDIKTVDSVQYPAQTMDFKSGNCSDLTVLYASAMEALGIETALVTVPGHIFPAIAMTVEPSETARFARSEDLIAAGGRLWLPLEATMRDGDFLSAWAEAAREWREASALGQAALFPVHDAWTTYEAVGFSASGDPLPVTAPDPERIRPLYISDLERIALAEIASREERLKVSMASQGGSPRLHNSLGVLYASYGLFERAEASFQAALGLARYAPALANLGNVRYLQGRYAEAVPLLKEARAADPRNAAVLAALSRAAFAAGERALSEEAYSSLSQVDAELAARYSYLAIPGVAGTRAAETVSVATATEWME